MLNLLTLTGKKWRLLLVALLCCALPEAGLQADISKKYLALAAKVGQEYGPMAEKRILAWRRLVENSKDLSVAKKLKVVNDFFNQITFVSDIKHWGKEDYWATPIEFLATNGGDCEDFTIAKYFTLRELGIPDDKLRLVYVKALTLNQHHMVLAYYHKPTSIPVILDNLDRQLEPASKRGDLLPIYSFNAKNLWLAKEKGRGQLVGGSSRLSRWTDLNNRFAQYKN